MKRERIPIMAFREKIVQFTLLIIVFILLIVPTPVCGSQPFVSAMISQSIITPGDPLFIRGVAEGYKIPSIVNVWIFGPEFVTCDIANVMNDASFEYVLNGQQTAKFTSGQYIIIVQHPGPNQDIDTKCFGVDTVEGLIAVLNRQNNDDIYTKLQFLVEGPIIRIDPVGDRHVGDKFSISGVTNLPLSTQVKITIFQSGTTKGFSRTLQVVKGDYGLNKISLAIDTSGLDTGEYIITANAIGKTASATILFFLLESTSSSSTSQYFTEPTTVLTAETTPPRDISPNNNKNQGYSKEIVPIVTAVIVAVILFVLVEYIRKKRNHP